ncbi:pseudouridine synthase [Reinekea blandensis]|uniref:Putative RNA pseudouridylate synthase n=1 Tax=Reinekea blandensis MED297 TaxID=314283 RepID=A4BGF0_9GAMM|nr:pseudouridine synthase [Reinekea blandensis]EAR08756.1 putative RNA pseudouridylate synthase [Reinekea sp. MED297] [Reinekea blandensis MED297]
MKRPDHLYMSSQTLHGVASSLLVTPTEIPWQTVTEFFVARFPHLNPQALAAKIAAGRVYYDDGSPVPVDAPLIPGQRFWYFRENPNEPDIPFDADILYEDEQILVVDKPHFLSTTPVGQFMKHTVTTRLRNRTGNMAITPAHRLDRATAGVLLLTKQRAVREAYQSLFLRREVEKTYHALCHPNPELPEQFEINLHLKENTDNMFVRVLDAPPNSHTSAKRLARHSTGDLYELRPSSGRKHQLRCQMAHLGAGIVNDIWYPVAQDPSPDDFSRPLQLLAKKLAFIDPFSGQRREFVSRKQLTEIDTDES